MIEKLVSQLAVSKTELEDKDPADEIAKLQTELLELQHRQILAKCLPQIEDYVQKRQWADRATKAGGNTKHITSKHNELFKQLVTDRYIQLFERT